jgi:hypothetical protein
MIMAEKLKCRHKQFLKVSGTNLLEDLEKSTD